MTRETYFAGDRIVVPAKLRDGFGLPFEIATGSVVQGILVQCDGKTPEDGVKTIDENEPGSDWGNSTVVFVIESGDSADIELGRYDLMVYVTDIERTFEKVARIEIKASQV